MRRRTWIVVLMVVALTALPACQRPPQVGQPSPSSTPATPSTSVPSTGTGTGGGTGQQAQVFTTTFTPLNQSGVSGAATVTIVPGGTSGGSVTVELDAAGVVPDRTHAMHIHGFADGRPSTCPSDTPGTIITEPTAERSYGPVLMPLEPFPTATGDGRITYSQQGVSVPQNISPSSGALYSIVIHGLVTEGRYDPTLPVACGDLEPAPAGSTGGTTVPGTTPGTGTVPSTTTPGGTATTTP